MGKVTRYLILKTALTQRICTSNINTLHYIDKKITGKVIVFRLTDLKQYDSHSVWGPEESQ